MKQAADEAVKEAAFDKGLAAGEQKGLQKGREEGLVEGKQKGREEEKKEIARKMIQSGMDLLQVMALTGLSEKTVSDIK